MYDLWIAVIYGIVEGLTEFLPVSSTGHMILTGELLQIAEDEFMTSFQIMIQLGAILAVTVLYWKRILRLFGLGKKQEGGMNLLHIALAIVPALGLGYLFKDFIKGTLFSGQTVVISLVVGGILLIIAEKFHPKQTVKDIDELTYKQAFMIGLWQILALWPGFSRSGATIAGAMLGGTTRGAAADFTFIIAIPVMVVTTGYELLQSLGTFTTASIGFFLTGFIVSFVVALLAVVTFIKFVQKFSLTYFAYYRFVLAALFWFFILK